MGTLWYYSWERPAADASPESEEKHHAQPCNAGIAEGDEIDFFTACFFRKHLGMYLCGFGAEWLFASVFTYFIIFLSCSMIRPWYPD